MTTVDVAHLAEELASLTDAVKRLGALAQQPVQPQSSVEIARNSKGVTWVSLAMRMQRAISSDFRLAIDNDKDP